MMWRRLFHGAVPRVPALQPFLLEEYLATREFSSPYMFCGSDVQTRSIRSILSLEPGSEQKFLDLSLAYSTTEGHKDLRVEISRQYSTISPDDVLCFAGAEEAIYATMRVLLRSGDHVVAIHPCYQSLATARGLSTSATPSSRSGAGRPRLSW
eukprot:c5477_g1_i2.p2 GENE.c5477_g1_i2~~c5477_g1_i2.p2  ORF type:complete len:153 (-),score=22.12 c5477_g1_i2:281-739(-)